MELLEFMMELDIQYICCDKYDSICQRDRYLIRVKSGIIYVISPNHAKIKVDSYNSLPPGETMAFHNVIILIKSVFDKDEITATVSYSQKIMLYMNYLKMILCIKYNCYIMTELTFLKELMLIRQANQKSAFFVTIGLFQKKGLSFNHICAVDAMIYQ